MTATTSEITSGAKLAYRNLIGDQLWERLVHRLVRDEAIERDLAERIMNEALGFLQLCAREPDGKFSPSATVDIGWHVFVLYTKDYANFSQRVAGRFLHHEPTDDPGTDYSDGFIPKQTMQVMRKYGPVDEMLWTQAASCEGGGGGGGSSCHGGCDGGSCR